jgi:hypothetical protein
MRSLITQDYLDDLEADEGVVSAAPSPHPIPLLSLYASSLSPVFLRSMTTLDSTFPTLGG